jgi:hypothetical protein
MLIWHHFPKDYIAQLCNQVLVFDHMFRSLPVTDLLAVTALALALAVAAAA